MSGWPAKILLPRNDVVAKMLLANPQRLGPLSAIVQDLLGLPEGEMTGVTLVDPNLYPEHEDEKHSIADVRLNTRSFDIDVEIQQLYAPTQSARWLHYVGKMTTGPVKSGEEYRPVPIPALIPITYYSWLPDERYHHWFRYFDQDAGLAYPDSPWIRPIELPKVPAESDGSRIWRWCRFFMASTAEEFDRLAEREGGAMAETVAALKELSADEKARLRAEAREKWLWDQASRESRSRAEGEAAGEARGRAEGKAEGKAEVARRLLRMKMSLSDIASATGLSAAEVGRLAAEEKA